MAQTSGDTRRVGPLAASYWLNRVKPGGEWDDKVHGGRSDMSREGMGNAAYAATAKALGLPSYVARNGAGTVQFYQNLGRYLDRKPMAPANGLPVFLPPYGDDLRDDMVVRSFYDRPLQPPR